MLAIKNILYATDCSGHSKFAFQLACSLARDFGARLVMLHVTDPPVGLYGDCVLYREPPGYLDPLRKQLQRLGPRDPSIHVEHRVEEGDAATEILRLAEETRADLIVMGTHGRTGLRRFIAGSVAEQVVRRAPCPVLTVKQPVAPGGTGTASRAMGNAVTIAQ
jgi:nucleotide-binding universal stress UspA family protein